MEACEETASVSSSVCAESRADETFKSVCDTEVSVKSEVPEADSGTKDEPETEDMSVVVSLPDSDSVEAGKIVSWLEGGSSFTIALGSCRGTSFTGCTVSCLIVSFLTSGWGCDSCFGCCCCCFFCCVCGIRSTGFLGCVGAASSLGADTTVGVAVEAVAGVSDFFD